MSVSLSPTQRLELIWLVNDLPGPEFETLLFALKPKGGVVPSNVGAQGNRAKALLEWVEGPTGCGLAEFLKVLERIAPGKFTPFAIAPPTQTGSPVVTEAFIPRALQPIDEMYTLEPEQELLLCQLVEVYRQTPTDEQTSFWLQDAGGRTAITHPGFKQHSPKVRTSDVETLEGEGLVRFSPMRQRAFREFNITPKGFKYYEHLKTKSGEPAKQLEREIKQYLDAESFQARYPAAYQKWGQAERLLWGANGEQQEFTVIGHYCREAIQEFADVLIYRYQVPESEPDKAKTVRRIRSVLNMRRSQLGKSKHAFLEALLSYWGTVSDLTQRQEHGGQREEEPLIWEDGRRIIFQTMVVMFEIDRTLTLTSVTR